MKRQTSIQRQAHDSGDGFTLMHCPFCGSGAIVARSDLSTECTMCFTVFTVQVQPIYPSMPQSDPGMAPGASPLGSPDGVVDMPAGSEEPDMVGGEDEGDDMALDDEEAPVEDEEEGGNPFTGARYYITSSGKAITQEAYMLRLAIEHADNPSAVISAARR